MGMSALLVDFFPVAIILITLFLASYSSIGETNPVIKVWQAVKLEQLPCLPLYLKTQICETKVTDISHDLSELELKIHFPDKSFLIKDGLRDLGTLLGPMAIHVSLSWLSADG